MAGNEEDGGPKEEPPAAPPEEPPAEAPEVPSVSQPGPEEPERRTADSENHTTRQAGSGDPDRDLQKYTFHLYYKYECHLCLLVYEN